MRKLLGVLAVAALLIAGCGGGDDDNAAENASAKSDTTAAANSSGDFGDFCGVRSGFNAATPDVSSGGNIKDTLQTAHSNLAKAVGYSPAEIKVDVQTVVDGFNVYYDAIAKADFNFQALASNPEAMASLQKLQDSKYQEAAERINAWVEAHCK